MGGSGSSCFVQNDIHTLSFWACRHLLLCHPRPPSQSVCLCVCTLFIRTSYKISNQPPIKSILDKKTYQVYIIPMTGKATMLAGAASVIVILALLPQGSRAQPGGGGGGPGGDSSSATVDCATDGSDAHYEESLTWDLSRGRSKKRLLLCFSISCISWWCFSLLCLVWWTCIQLARCHPSRPNSYLQLLLLHSCVLWTWMHLLQEHWSVRSTMCTWWVCVSWRWSVAMNLNIIYCSLVDHTIIVGL